MSIDLSDYENKTVVAIKQFWQSRGEATQRQADSGAVDTGERSSVTAGKNMEGFNALFTDLIHANGLAKAEVHTARRVVTLPGFFRPTKQWDIVVMNGNHLLAVLEFKSQAGPSFGNNFNNRTEEAIGSSHDLWTAYREGAFGDQVRPFLGWLMLIEDVDASSKPVAVTSPHFPVFDEFKGASYQERYNIFCQRLVKENLYSAATLLASPRAAVNDGTYKELSDLTSIKTLVSGFAAHVAAEAARSK